jgi:subtilase family serine protease
LGPIAFSALGSPGAAGVAGAALQPKVMLPQAPPTLPAGTAHLGAAPSDQQLDLDVALAGQNQAGLALAVSAVSTPGSPEYHHYLSASQFAAAYGPSASEVAQVSSALRSEGLTVGTPEAGSILLPVHGTAAVVSAAFATPLEQVQTPNGPRALVNTLAPAVPSSLTGLVTGVVGLNGLFTEHSMARPSPSPTSGNGSGAAAAPNAAAPSPAGGQSGSNTSHAAVAHAGTPQACAAASGAAGGGIYTSTQMSSLFGLDQLFGQGRTGVGQTIAIVEFEQYSSNDYQAFLSCYGLSNPIRNVIVDGGPGGPSQGAGEAALDTELAAFNAPSASLVVYEAPNTNDAQAFDMFNRIASDDSAQVVTTSWGNCEPAMPTADLQTEDQIFQRMAMQGQTIIAAAGDAGSSDCFSASASGGIPAFDTALAVDDPGSQPDVISAGGTTLPSSGVGAQVVWNDCERSLPSCARAQRSGQLENGATGGGYSMQWPKPTYQPTTNGSSNRAVPDLSYPSDPSEGAVVAYWDGAWHGFGGTSVAAPTNAGLFADTNQGCFSPLGMIGPNLYANGGSGNENFTDITTGDNDFTDSNPGDYPATAGYDPASGLGTPIDQNLAIALQGANGCPSVASVSPNTGPVSGSGAITITGGGFANATSVTFGSVGTGQILSQSETSITVIPPNTQGPLCVDVTVGNSQGISATSPADHYGFGGNLDCGQGYRFVASDGGVFAFGDASFWGSTGGMTLNKPVVGMASTPSTSGYWLVASDGGIFSYGDAQFYGSMGGKPLNEPIVGMASTPNGRGYWLVAADGGIFSYGDAPFFGSTGSMHLNKPIVGMAATPDGGGYWLVASDGGIFAYGDAQFHGSTGSMVLNSPVVGVAAGPGPAGAGYWLVAADGGIFAYGSAQFWGSAGSLHLNQPVVGMAATPDASGYWLVAGDGGVFTYGDAKFYGSTGSIHLNKPIVGMSSA